MAQLFLPFQYQADTSGHSTAFAGLPLYFEMSMVSGVIQSIARNLTLRQAGWDDVSVVLSLILLNLAGGTCVEDIQRLEQDWHPLIRKLPEQTIETGQEYAEVVYVPNAIGHKKDGPHYRFIVTREKIAQLELPSTEHTSQLELPFASIQMPAEKGDVVRYKIQALVTTLDWEADRVIWWLRERCGKSEEVHAIMKDDLAGGRLPSQLFGANAAWWIIMLIALNLNMTMKWLVLGRKWLSRRMKAVRYHIIQVGGRLVNHARHLYMKVSGTLCEHLKEWRMRIYSYAQPRAG
jgi:hypothetical protein